MGLKKLCRMQSANGNYRNWARTFSRINYSYFIRSHRHIGCFSAQHAPTQWYYRAHTHSLSIPFNPLQNHRCELKLFWDNINFNICYRWKCFIFDGKGIQWTETIFGISKYTHTRSITTLNICRMLAQTWILTETRWQ